MSTSNTDPLVLVLGAGASKEVGLPIGTELTKSIAEALNFKIDYFLRLTGGDDRIRECIYKLAQAPNNSHATPDDYYRAAMKIREAMPLALSIDNFIDSHRADNKIAQIGKLAISACILRAEKGSTLYLDRSNLYNKLDFENIAGTWFASLFSLISQYCSYEELEIRFSRLTVISFNYDRCFKHFLRQALLTYYSLTELQAESIASKVSILHPYGSVGRMRFETGGSGIDYGEQPVSDDLLKSAEGIKTFTESTDPAAEEIKTLRESIANAKTLVFLGFGFHPMNLELLYGQTTPERNSRNCDVLGTAKGISDSNKALIVQDLVQMGGYAEDRIALRQELTAGGLISEYYRHLSRSVHSE
jgi:hypothetical protein